MGLCFSLSSLQTAAVAIWVTKNSVSEGFEIVLCDLIKQINPTKKNMSQRRREILTHEKCHTAILPPLNISDPNENVVPIKQARNLRRCALKAGKTSTRKTENLAHLTYLHAESGMRNKSKLGHL